VVTPQRVQERAATRHEIDANGCHVSTYSTGSHGYAQIGWWEAGKTHMTVAHRAAWEHHYGPIPDGMTVDHTCKTRTCVNVDHMRLLENFENARRTAGRDWPLGFCARGHSNGLLRVGPTGARTCRVCAREDQVAHRARKKAQEVA